MIILGVILLVIAFFTHMTILWTLGIIALIVGVALMIGGRLGHQVGGRPHWY